MPFTVSIKSPVLLKVTVMGELEVDTSCAGKVKPVGARDTAGGAIPTPVPVRVTICGLAGAPSEKSSEALRMPLAVGVNVIPTVQLAPGGTVVPGV